ncbi:hypothetical protein [uncultured Microbacterium sp.]|nr:hypothetical protein [uncultured Microbacterium sp.]
MVNVVNEKKSWLDSESAASVPNVGTWVTRAIRLYAKVKAMPSMR